MADHALRAQVDVHRIPAPKTGEAVYFDEGRPKDRVSGLGLRIRSAGSRKFVFFYRHGGRLQKYTIGDATSWTLDAARTEARKLRVTVDNQQNPADRKNAQRADAALLFSTVKDDYLAVREKDMRPRSYEETKRHLDKHWKGLHQRAVGSIDRGTIAGEIRTIVKNSGDVAANRARSTLSRFFAWTIGEGYRNDNPVIGTNKQAESGRERVLTDAELVKIWRAAPDNEYGRIVKLLMLTMQRRDEIGGLQRPEIQSSADSAKALIALPGERTKNRRAHDVPLSATALVVLTAQPEIVGRELVFGSGASGYSGWSKSKDALDEACGVTDWTLHDLRRTGATRLADPVDDGGLGVQPHIIEAIMNHVSGHKAGVAGIYNRRTYAAEKRDALNRWAAHLLMLVAKAEGANVTKLPRRKA
jgi:integrase